MNFLKFINIKAKIKENENSKIVFINVALTFLIKGAAIVISLLTMPGYLIYFDNHQLLGLWFTILALLSTVLTLDLGIGNGLRNYLVLAIVKKEDMVIKSLISSSYIAISIIVLITISIFTLVANYINWNVLFNVPESVVSSNTLNLTVQLVFAGTMVQFLLKLISSILYAMQKSAVINLIALLSSLLILIFILCANYLQMPTNIVLIAIIHILSINLPLLVATVVIFSTSLKKSKPALKYFKKAQALQVIKLGGSFFWIQIMYMLIISTNEFFISWLTDPSKVVEYQIYTKLFLLVGTIFTLALTPMWSIITKASAEKNYVWILKTYKNLKLLALVAIVSEFLLIIVLQYGINIWLGDNAIKVNYFYATIFAVLGSITIWNGVLASVANGLGELKAQRIFYTLGFVLKIPIAWILVHILDSWIGVIIANIIAMSFYCIIQPFWLNKILLNKNS